MKLELYPWQERCLEIWNEHHHHGIVNVVTGAGKTILAIAAIQHLKQTLSYPIRVRIVVPTTHLLTQWSASLSDFSDVSRREIGYYYGSRKDPEDNAYMIYVINSARYALARHILNDIRQGYAVFLIADECHHYASDENKKIFDFLPPVLRMPGGTNERYFSLGLSATPQTSGYESVLVPALGPEIYRYGFSDAAKKHTISRFSIFQIALTLNPEEQAAYNDMNDRISRIIRRLTAIYPALKQLNNHQFFARLNLLADASDSIGSTLASTLLVLTYQRKTLICNAESRLFCACKLIDSLDVHDKIILFGERIEQADSIYELLSRQYQHQVARCHSGMGKHARKNALERFRTGEIRILVSCRALDEGFDVPAANVGIVLSSAAVERQRIQRLGRILRRRPGKDIASLYYFYLEGSVEEPFFFSQLPDEAYCCNLSYSYQEDTFCFPEYEEKAVQVLTRIRQTTSDDSIHQEALTCLLEGMVRPDRFLSCERKDEMIRSSKTNHERNYWICMKEMDR